jgi:hypothetical protein
VVWCTMGYHIKFGGVITLAQAYGKIISLWGMSTLCNVDAKKNDKKW